MNLRIRRRDLKYLLVFAIASSIVTSGTAYVMLNPPRGEDFLAMWILGSNGLAEHYFPHESPDLSVDEEMNWTLGVYNHMGTIQYVVLKVKLLNSSQSGPDDLTGAPSNTTSLVEFRRVLLNNETWLIPFLWKIVEVNRTNHTFVINTIAVNQYAFHGELAGAISGFNYRFVFELWFYDVGKDALTFSWEENGSKHSVWTQMWFNMSAPR